jgi:hypothetical protein
MLLAIVVGQCALVATLRDASAIAAVAHAESVVLHNLAASVDAAALSSS